ncbi:MAG: DUF6512 family protein [Eubacteriales bacterium]|nr:DUF6512 family protein [Eubacteriales bacterium]
MNSKLFRNLEILGIPVVFLFASFLHFLYDITGKSVLGSLFGSVNESVWEHLKIFFIAYVFWGFVELLWARPKLSEFIFAKAVGVYILCFLIALFFYIYTFFTGKAIFIVDIIASLLLTCLAHIVSYRLTLWQGNKGQYFALGLMMLFVGFTAVLCFTFYPPKLSLFRDPITGNFGVPPKNIDEGAQVLSEVFAQKTTAS